MSNCSNVTTRLIEQFASIWGNGTGVTVGQAADVVNGIGLSHPLVAKANNALKCPSQPLPTNSSTELWHKGGSGSVELLEAIWTRVFTPDCYSSYRLWQQRQTSDYSVMPAHTHVAPPAGEIWGYGLLCVTIINLCALLGIVFLPCMGKRVYKLVLAFMVSLGVGTLVSSALMVLVPGALQLAFVHQEVNKPNSSLFDRHHHHHYDQAFHAVGGGDWHNFLSAHPWYIWKSTVACVGIYGFFLLERLLKEIAKRFTGSNNRVSDMSHGHSHGVQPLPDQQEKEKEKKEDEEEKEDVADLEAAKSSTAEDSNSNSSLMSKLIDVQPVAWMIIVGDAVHNFIDGLGIGAAFTQSTLSGVSVSLAVLCEELPHELGDFAIMLSAGMSMPMALLFNFLSACLCYVGFCLGVLLAEAEGSAVWVFAIAAGMFLYIGLVDMLPEVGHALDQPDAKYLGKVRIFLLQNLGLCIGFGAILILSLYGHIHLE